MSTKNKTDSSQNSTQATTFDPGSMQRYQGWAASMMPQLQALFSNPMGSPFFNQNVQTSTKAASGLAGRNISNSLLNFNRSGVGSGSMFSGARNSLMGSLNRYGSGMQFGGFSTTPSTTPRRICGTPGASAHRSSSRSKQAGLSRATPRQRRQRAALEVGCRS